MSLLAMTKGFILSVGYAPYSILKRFWVFLVWWITERSCKKKLYDITLIASCVSAIYLWLACTLLRLRMRGAKFRLRIGNHLLSAEISPGPVPQWMLDESSPSVMLYCCKGIGILGSLSYYIIVTMIFYVFNQQLLKWLRIR